MLFRSVEKLANQYEWKYGDKIIRTFPERQGLKKHVLSCGNFLATYEWIIVLEDDLIVSPNFYIYAKQAVKYYRDDDRIAGISLYRHSRNVLANRSFQPRDSKYDVYFMQFAQSWGQVWMREAWEKFLDWYGENDGEDLKAIDFPARISNWAKSSWLKYHIKYCVETNRFFVYPYRSLSTCFADVGEHQKAASTIFQIPLEEDKRDGYAFCPFDNTEVKYDVYFEPISLPVPADTCIDLYGQKDQEYIASGKFRYCLTCKKLNLPVKKAYSLNMKPHEQNIIDEVEGNDIFLYEIVGSNITESRESISAYIHRFEYYQGLDCTAKEILGLAVVKLCRKFKKHKPKR